MGWAIAAALVAQRQSPLAAVCCSRRERIRLERSKGSCDEEPTYTLTHWSTINSLKLLFYRGMLILAHVLRLGVVHATSG